VLILMDQGWASAPDWTARKAAALAAVEEASQARRPVILWQAAGGGVPPVLQARAARAVLEAARPAPWAPDHAAVLAAIEAGEVAEPAQTIWFHDGLDHGEATAALAAQLADFGPLRLIGPAVTADALTPPRLEEGRMLAGVLRADGSIPATRSAASGRQMPVLAPGTPPPPPRSTCRPNCSTGSAGSPWPGAPAPGARHWPMRVSGGSPPPSSTRRRKPWSPR
jgi:hypothetical protein